MIGEFQSILKVYVFHGLLTRGQKVAFFTVISGFYPFCYFCRFLFFMVGCDMNFRFHMLLKGTVNEIKG